MPKLNSEKQQLQKNVNKLTKQLDDTEKRLGEERETRKTVEDGQEAKIKEVEASWKAILEEKTDNWEAKERSLEDKVENQERLLKEIKASYEVSQRLGQGAEENEALRNGSTAAELEIVQSDLEKTSARLADVEARNEQLRYDLAQAVSQSQSANTAQDVEDDPAFLRLRSENSALLRKLDAARFDKDSEKNNWDSKLRQTDRTLAQLTAERDEFRTKLQKCADYDDLKRELEVIKVSILPLIPYRRKFSTDNTDNRILHRRRY